jgi:hypothetical protein
MSETPQNRYLGLSKKELKSLKRANKGNPEALKLIDEAFDALKPPYKAGRLSNVDISAVAEIATSIVKIGAGGQTLTFDEAVSKNLVEKAEQLLTAVRPFLITNGSEQSSPNGTLPSEEKADENVFSQEGLPA